MAADAATKVVDRRHFRLHTHRIILGRSPAIVSYAPSSFNVTHLPSKSVHDSSNHCRSQLFGWLPDPTKLRPLCIVFAYRLQGEPGGER